MIRAYWYVTVSRVSPEVSHVPVWVTGRTRPNRVVIEAEVIDDQAAAVLAEWRVKLPAHVRVEPGTPTTLTQYFRARTAKSSRPLQTMGVFVTSFPTTPPTH